MLTRLTAIVTDAGIYPTVIVQREITGSRRVVVYEKGGWIELAWQRRSSEGIVTEARKTQVSRARALQAMKKNLADYYLADYV